MKNLISLSILFATTALFAIDTQTMTDLSSEDIHTAQNARIIIEKSEGGETELLKALASETKEVLAGGLAYSLASMKSEKAYPQIVELAKKGNCTAMLALAKYGAKAEDVLKSLGGKCDSAKNAEFLANQNATRKMPIFAPNDILTKIIALSESGDKDAAIKIMQIQKDENLSIAGASPLIVITLAACPNGDEALLAEAKNGNAFAIKALKIKRLAEAEDILLELLKEADADIKREAADALSTCGSEKSLIEIAALMTPENAANLATYIKIATPLYLALDADKKDAITKLYKDKAEQGDSKVKAAIDRIITEPTPKDVSTKKK